MLRRSIPVANIFSADSDQSSPRVGAWAGFGSDPAFGRVGKS